MPEPPMALTARVMACRQLPRGRWSYTRLMTRSALGRACTGSRGHWHASRGRRHGAGSGNAGTVRYLLRNALYAKEVASDVRAVTDPETSGQAVGGERKGRVGLAA